MSKDTKKNGLIRNLVGNPKEDFSLKLIPGMVKDVKDRSTNEHSSENIISYDEFLNRYKNLKATYFVTAAFMIFSFYQAVNATTVYGTIGAFLTGLVFLLFLFGYGFRLWAARMAFKRRDMSSIRSDVPQQVTVFDYLRACSESPSNLLPLSCKGRP